MSERYDSFKHDDLDRLCQPLELVRDCGSKDEVALEIRVAEPVVILNMKPGLLSHVIELIFWHRRERGERVFKLFWSRVTRGARDFPFIPIWNQTRSPCPDKLEKCDIAFAPIELGVDQRDDPDSGGQRIERIEIVNHLEHWSLDLLLALINEPRIVSKVGDLMLVECVFHLKEIMDVGIGPAPNDALARGRLLRVADAFIDGIFND